MERNRDRAGMSRRTFLKASGAAAVGAACTALLPFGPFTLAEAEAVAAQTGETVVPTWCGMVRPAGDLWGHPLL